MPEKPNGNLIFVVAGEGGHLVQACRFIDLLPHEELRIILITDGKEIPTSLAADVCRFGSLSRLTKTRSLGDYALFTFRYFALTRDVFRLFMTYKPGGVVSFGPLFPVIFCIVGRLFFIKVLHIETWSRFKSRSTTGALMHVIASRFYIQNLELKKLYSRAIYCGKL